LVKGAGLLISSVCTQLHITKWRSAEFFNKVRLYFLKLFVSLKHFQEDGILLDFFA
jgi:hypothetical protein